MKTGIICQSCGIEAPVRQTEFHQNIGALVMRFHRSVKGNLCKNCVHKHFWQMTSITLAIGWLGMISLVLAPIFVINNLVRYLGLLGMPPVPPGAGKPQATQEMLKRFFPLADPYFARANSGEDLGAVARSLAAELGISPGEALDCMIVVSKIRQSSRTSDAQSGRITPPPLPPAKPPQPPRQSPPLLQPIPLENEQTPPRQQQGRVGL